ncbi:MAG: hypothetical protein RMY36_010535 [Nostoc sp. SerVER01]|nr:hypothetical protein [Nostoc sp. DedQUE11]MDZ8080639.1 hypothetical protein [Nostoc sp. DcaGUA01]
MERHRIMVIGNNVNTVQRLSNHCLKKNLEVFPYYGVPLVEEIDVFAPHVLVLCAPIHKDFQCQILQPWILWSEQTVDEEIPLVGTFTELYVRLQELLQI